MAAALIALVFCLGLPWQTETTKTRSDDVDPLQVIVTQQGQLITQLQAKLSALESRIARQEHEVAFFARLSQEHNGDAFTGTIVFDQVDLNQGGAYNQHTGVFTAPVSGIYEFNIKVSHIPPGSLHVHVVKNDHALAEVAGNGDDHYRDRSSASTVTHVNAGQKVWVEVMGSAPVKISTSAFQTTFMGILISAD